MPQRPRLALPGALLALALLLAGGAARSRTAPEPPGGSGTVSDSTENAFQHPFPTASRELRRQFFVGNAFFRDAWVAAPSSTTGRDGLGPTYNAVSCSGCHTLDGRGPPFGKSGRVSIALLFRLQHHNGTAFGPEPSYGGQLNPLAIESAEPEGRATVEFAPVPGTFADGTSYELRRPVFRFHDLRFGPFAPGTRVSPRLAPQLPGLGLLEAVREADILALADEKDSDGDGISGRANYVHDAAYGRTALGRFGWKAGQASLLAQNAAAFLGDIGITSSVFSEENCPPAQAKCREAPNGGSPELSDQALMRVTTYIQLLAVPSRRIQDPELVERGERRFHEVRCASCHHPSFTTGPHELDVLSGQKIFPYTDLLLHDMGMELADHSPEGRANGREWKTPPLWGIGLLPTVNRHQSLLHDGRARNVEEAILWHGGEGQASRELYKQLPAEDRHALLEFVNSL